jgi:hypothetical protein
VQHQRLRLRKRFIVPCFFLCFAGAVHLLPAVQAADAATGPAPKCGALHAGEHRIVDKWRGTWDVKAINRQKPGEVVTYTETFDWIFDGCYLRSETSRKSDGGQSMAMFWFDRFTKTYRYVIFDASGLAVELPPPAWNDSTQTMEWKSGLFAPFSYTAHVTFTDRDTIRWKSLWKDWKGTAILDLEGTSTRRK